MGEEYPGDEPLNDEAATVELDARKSFRSRVERLQMVAAVRGGEITYRGGLIVAVPNDRDPNCLFYNDAGELLDVENLGLSPDVPSKG